MGEENTKNLMLNLFATPVKIVKNNSFENLDLIDHCQELSKKVESGGGQYLALCASLVSGTGHVHSSHSAREMCVSFLCVRHPTQNPVSG